MEFYELFKMYREERGFKRGDIARILRIDVSYIYIYKYERGKRIPRKELLDRMCKLFNVSEKELLGDSAK